MSRAVRTGMGIVLAALLQAGSASALTLGVSTSSPGLDQGFGYVCSGNCTVTYELSAPAAVGAGGTIAFAGNLASSTDTATISLSVPVSLFVQTPSGTDTVSFSLAYSAVVNATVTPFGSFVQVSQDGAASGSVSGSYVATAGGSGPLAIAGIDVNSLNCFLSATNQGSCGVTFGITGFPVTVGGGPVYFQHTFNLIVPEPGALALLLLGGLASAGRRRAR